MKKILALTLLLLSYSGFACATALPTHTATASGAAIFGGTSLGNSQANTANPLVRFSTGVQGLVNFVEVSTAPGTSVSYALVTKHVTGSKYFGTANDSTNIYWYQSVKGDLNAGIAGATDNNANFAGEGWTAY